jgi:uncharacterized delta-60 repeat protein
MSPEAMIRITRVLVLTTVGICALAPPAFAAPGDLDPTFSSDGKITPHHYEIDDVALQPNGKIVAVGPEELERFNPDGTVDEGFDPDGDILELSPTAVAIQPDGKIVLAGVDTTGPQGGDFAVVRLEADGSLDPSFSGDGIVETDFGGRHDRARALTLRSDGGIVVAGTSASLDEVPTRDFAVAQYLSDGTLDPSFSTDGKRTLNIGADDLRAVVVDSSDRIVIAGGASGDFTLMRLESGGSRDPGFSGDGRVSPGFPGLSEALGLALQDDGRLVAAGTVESEDGPELAIVRFDGDGTLDAAFSSNGKAVTDLAVGGGDVAIQPDGAIVVAGRSAAGDFAVVRYLADGSLDPSFSGDGVAAAKFPMTGEASALAIQPDGRIVAGGFDTVCDGRLGCFDGGALARYLVEAGPPDADADGVLDPDDACPELFNPDNRRGCPVYEGSATLTYNSETQRFAGHIDFPPGSCPRVSAPVRLLRERRGPDEFVASGRTLEYGVVHFSGRDARGWYYLRARRRVLPNVGICRPITSPPVGVKTNAPRFT